MEADVDATWRQVPLGSIVLRCDYGLPCSLDGDEKGIPVLRMGNLTDGKVSTKDLKYIPVAKLPSEDDLLSPGDILLNRTNSADRVGKVGLFIGGPRTTFASYLFRLRVREELICPEWLAQVLSSPPYQDRLRRLATPGVSQTNINRTALLELSVPLPPLSLQRKIASVLCSVDATIEKTQAVIDQLEVVENGVLSELLARGMPGRHKEFRETEIGLLPSDWIAVRVGEVCERMFVGVAQAATHAYVASGGVPIVRTTNLRPNDLDASRVLRISHEFAAEMASKQLRTGDVLTARTGHPGTSAVVPPSLDGSQCFTLLVSRPGRRIQGAFLSHLMNSHIGRQIVAKGQAGGAQQNLNVSVLSAALIPLPSMQEQSAIVGVLDSVQRSRETEQYYLQGLTKLKNSLLDALLTGSIRVPSSAQEAA